jgi:hypothetical protein
MFHKNLVAAENFFEEGFRINVNFKGEILLVET